MSILCSTLQAQENDTENTIEVPVHELSDCPMTFEKGKWKLNSKGKPQYTLEANDSVEFKGTVNALDDATLLFNINASYCQLKIFVDGELIKHLDKDQFDFIQFNNYGYFVSLSKGSHNITFRIICDNNRHDIYFDSIGTISTPQISVNLLEPGSLGTEVLYNVDHLNDVRSIKISGKLNSDDFEKITMMKNLFRIDLTDAEIEELPSSGLFTRFNGIYPDRIHDYLYDIKLPKELKRINSNALYKCLSENIEIPENVTTIRESAFENSRIRKANINKIVNIEDKTFYSCKLLEDIVFSDSLKIIRNSAFSYCTSLSGKLYFPESLQEIKDNAFNYCTNLNIRFPKHLKRIGVSITSYTSTDSVFFCEGITFSSYSPINNTQNLVYAEFPTSFSSNKMSSLFDGCNKLKTLVLKSPTVVKLPQEPHIKNLNAVTIKVPSYLINSYKLDSYWYEANKIEGFSTSEIKEWTLNSDLVLGPRDRLEGTPSIRINTGGSIKINGTDGMTINNLTNASNPGDNVYGRMFSNADDVTVCGKLNTELNIKETNKWYYLSIPYDVRISDITPIENNSKRAIRYYDGANRAEKGIGESWKNFSDEDIIPAGTGFIFQASEKEWWNFPAMENETKQYLTSNNMFAKALAQNESEKTSDSGWNLIGNPYQCWYNIHKLNFTAPITVRNISKNNYEAYSVIDDDYALAPNQAFFVQCPEGITDISFPLDGRQMTSVIESQSGAKPHGAAPAVRTITDLQINNGTYTDHTRVVINEKTSAGYEMACDAAKFMSESDYVPQVYTYDDEGNKYAINERPSNNGIVKIGFTAGNNGCFTFSLKRNTASEVILTDHETGTSVNLMSQDYNFTSNAGTYQNRFELRILTNGATAIQETMQTTPNINTFKGGMTVTGHAADIYNMKGIKVAHAESGMSVSLPAGTYIVRNGEYKVKVIIL